MTLCAAAVAIMLVVNVVALVLLLVRSPRTHDVVSAPVLPNAAEIGSAASWATAALAHDARIVADPDVGSALKKVGFRNIQTASARPASNSGEPLSFDYLVSSAALRAMARSSGPLARAAQASLPIAVFGSGARQLIVRQVSTESGAAIASRQRADKATRLSAERQLLANPAIHASTAARALLLTGGLDLRAATVLALMASSSHVDIRGVNVNQAERAAGLPARSIDVRTDAAPAVQAILSNLPPSYRPSSDAELADGTLRIVWPVMADPPAELN